MFYKVMAVVWLIYGIWAISTGITKLDYVCMWIVLMMEFAKGVVRECEGD